MAKDQNDAMSPLADDDDYDSDQPSIHSSDEEDPRDYKAGGYHPVSIGDRFKDGRYIIVRKLGWGHFSTVWLARDTLADCFVSLKIVKSEPHYYDSALEEIKILEAIKRADPTAEGREYVAQLLDHFFHTGPNGKHVCMTFEVLGETLLSLIKRYHHNGIPQPIVKRITRQVALGLDYLHRQCNIVHTDLKPENVLVCIPDVDEYLKRETAGILDEIEKTSSSSSSLGSNSKAPSEQQQQQEGLLAGIDTTGMSKSKKKRLKKQIKKEKEKATKDEDHQSNGINHLSKMTQDMTISEKRQPKIIPTAVLDFTWHVESERNTQKQMEPYKQIKVKIVDLGNACWLDEENTHIIQTRQYRSPEVIVAAPWNDRADIWSLGTLVFELLTGEFLFDPRSGRHYEKDDDHLAQIIELTGDRPKSMTMHGTRSSYFFNRKGELKQIKKLKYRRLRDVIHDQFGMSPSDADEISEFLLPMLAVDPNKRASAQAVLQARWLRDESE